MIYHTHDHYDIFPDHLFPDFDQEKSKLIRKKVNLLEKYYFNFKEKIMFYNKMGLGPSYQPDCPHCGSGTTVVYIFKDYILHNELLRWKLQQPTFGDEIRYWACENCINEIPKKYHDRFKYDENFRVYGM